MAWLFVELTRFFMLVFAALVLAVIFDAMARKVKAVLPVNRAVALGISVVALLAVFIGAFTLFGTQLAAEFETITEHIGRASRRERVWQEGWNWGVTGCNK